jgi:hypothetical protein
MAIGFFDGNKADASPESIKRKRALIAQMMASSRAPRNIGEGLNSIGDSIASGILGYRADKEEQQVNASSAEAFRNIYSGFGGGAPRAAVGGAPVASGPSTPAVTPTAGTGILSFANQGATRNQPIVDELQGNIQTAVSTVFGDGYKAQVYSGGQPGIGSGGKRVGSTRHDHGNAADVYIIDPQGKRVTGDKLALLGRHWLQNGKGGVGMEMKGGGIHLDVHRNRAPIWTYGAVSPAQAALVKEFGGRPPRIIQTASAGPQSNDAQMQDGAGELQAGGSEMMGGGYNPFQLRNMAPPADAMGQGIADNEEQTRMMEAQMAAEQGLPYAGNEPGAVNQSDVFSPVPMGLGPNPFLPRESDAMAQAPAPMLPQMDRVTFDQVTAGLPQRAPAFTGQQAGLAPSWAGDPDKLAPGAEQASFVIPARDTVALPAANNRPPQSPLVPPAMRQPIAPMEAGENGAGAMQFIESEFARREGRPDPRMAVGAPQGYNPFVQQPTPAPQMPAGGGSVQGVSQGDTMASGPAQAPAQASNRIAYLASIAGNPMVRPEVRQLAMAEIQTERARAQADADRARTQAQNEAAADALGVDRRLANNQSVFSAAAAAKLGNKTENIPATVAVREAEGRRLGLQGPALQQFALTGQLPNAAINENKIAAETKAREAEAARIGLKPGDPRYQNFVLTGKMPREDTQPLTATDKKAIMEADDGVMAAQSAIASLQRAKSLSAEAYQGPLAAQRGYATSILGDKAGSATVQLNNEVTTNALTQLKSIFGAAPTEGERKILLDIQGSASLAHADRVKIYERAEALAQRRLEFAKKQADGIRGGDYYKPEAQRGQGQPAQTNTPAQASSALQNARKAIADGAPRQAVIDRLRQAGIDPGGL